MWQSRLDRNHALFHPYFSHVSFPWEGLCEAPGVSAEPQAGRDKEQKLVSPRECVSSYVCVHLCVEDSVVGGHGCLPALF